MSSDSKVLTLNTINPNVLKAEYAVRGGVPAKAAEYEAQLAKGEKLPFDSIVYANIGNPQQQPNLAQPPLTFWRQVAALTELPDLMESEALPAETRDKLFPTDAQQRARELLGCFGSVGAYTASKGSPYVRKHVCEYIEERDGHPLDIEDVYLTAGASAGVSLLFSIFFRAGPEGVMIPIPQYPLYSATLQATGVKAVHYTLDAKDHWQAKRATILKSIADARKEGITPRAIVVINPGNPTGACMTTEEVQDMLKIAYKERLVIFADEVYQKNIYYKDHPFVSFRKVLLDYGKSSDAEERAMSESVELVSMHSISKGMSGECGRRGGYFQLTNIDQDVEAQVGKMSSVHLCPPVQGQIGVDMLVRPPKKDEPSYTLWEKETTDILATMKKRSETMAERFGKLPGVSIEPATGAMYLFPSVHLPPAALKEAERQGKSVDEFYCLELLGATGICVVPGAGFGKQPHVLDDGSVIAFFRTTILAKQTDQFIERYGGFHTSFLDKFS